MPKPCSITVVTATLNAAKQFAITLDSMRRQTFRDVEWLVVDGGSTDGMVELLEKSADVVTWWSSEPDRGIYDAWNKACQRAGGDWLLFLGAGDEFPEGETLSNCMQYLRALPEQQGLAYGRLELVSAVGRQTLETLGKPWGELAGTWEIGRPALPPHGACFHRKSLFAGEEPFDLRFPIAADSHFMLRYLASPGALPPAFIPQLITLSPIGGLSFRLDVVHRLHDDISAINCELGLRPPLAHRIKEMARRGLAGLLCRLAPDCAQRLADGLRRLTGKPPRWSVR